MSTKEKRSRANRKKAGRKIPLTAGKRMICVAAGILSLAGAIVCGIRCLPDRMTMEEQTDYTYVVSADSAYRVRLIPNELYEEEWMEEGGLYSSHLTDEIEVSLNASFSGSAPAAAGGTYTVTGIVEGYQEGKNGRRTIYERRFPLKRGEALENGKGGADIQENVSLRLEPYRQAAAQADVILGAAPARRFYLLFEGSLQAGTEYGKAEEPFSLSLQIPIQEQNGFYEITKSEPLSRQGKITSQAEVRTSPAPFLAPAIGIWAIGSAAVVLWVLLGTRIPDELEEYRRQGREILRKYASHMIQLEHLDESILGQGTEVADVQNLILAAEEIHRPVCYSLDGDGLPKGGVFYIPDGDRGYVFRMKRPMTPDTTFVAGRKEKSGTGHDGQ